MNSLRLFIILTMALLAGCTNYETTTDNRNFIHAVDYFFQPIHEQGKHPFTYSFDYTYTQQLDDNTSKVRHGYFTLSRESSKEFNIAFKYKHFKMQLGRSADRLHIYIPHSSTLFLDKQAGSETDSDFTIENSLATALEMEPKLKLWYDFLKNAKGDNFEQKLSSLGLKLQRETDSQYFENYRIVNENNPIFSCKVDRSTGHLAELTIHMFNSTISAKVKLTSTAEKMAIPATDKIKKTIAIDDHELHRSLTRAAGRIAEIRYLEAQPPSTENFVKSGPYGHYRMIDGQRVIKLKGNPQQIGWQHGQFLSKEIRRVTDSTLYLVGLVYSVKKGRWFFNEIRNALERLDKFTPPEYLEEMKAVAEGSGVAYESVHLANYFPALFHCSGFALKDSATTNGRLYHGRILDYMCEVGLQNNAVVFAVEKDGKIPFVNVGYASFVGSVSGMNQQKLSLGEMGGQGEGDWDGVTMPLLMRMSLENARTLDDVKKIFSDNPRTCEYYYVFTDGKDRRAVGVYAIPEKIEFVNFGEKHPEMRYSFKDSILMSGGDRYKCLADKVEETHSLINEEAAIELMNHPVATYDHNLHSVLFIPELLRLRVANAGRHGAAFKNKFYSYSLSEILKDSFYAPENKSVKK